MADLSDERNKIYPKRMQAVITRCKKAVEGITVLKNIISYYVSLSTKIKIPKKLLTCLQV